MELAIGLLSLCFVALMYLLTDKVLIKLKELTEICKKINNQTESEELKAFKKSRTDAITYGTNVSKPTTAGFMAYQVDPIKQEVSKSVEENYYPETTVELPTEIKVAKKTGPKPRLRTEEEMQFIISSILSDKKERGNTSATLFKKYKITKATFYKYATEDQSKELVEMQTALRKKRNFSRGRK